MKLNRTRTIAVLIVVLGICTGILLSGCATIGEGKDAESGTESSKQIDKGSSSVEETGAGSPEVRKTPVAHTNSAGGKQHVQVANQPTDKDMFKQNAMYLKQALDRILPETLSEMNWNRIATVFTGILLIAMIYGLAFGLGRLSHRRRSISRRGMVDE
jgi:hypothetical protein